MKKKELTLTKEQGKLLIESLIESGEIELYIPHDSIPSKKTGNIEKYRVGNFTITRYDAPESLPQDEHVRVGFKYAQYFKLLIKKLLK